MFVYLAWLNACDKQTSYEICEIIASDKTFHMVRYFFFFLTLALTFDLLLKKLTLSITFKAKGQEFHIEHVHCL